jgi:hypothetical protein
VNKEKVTGFEDNLEVGNKFERKIRALLTEYDLPVYGTEPGLYEDGSAPNHAKEQKDIVVYRDRFHLPESSLAAVDPTAWRAHLVRDNARVVEVKSFSKPFYPSIMLDCAKTWNQKKIEPTAVVLVQQSAPHDILVAHIPTVRHALKEVERRVWDKATQNSRYKVNIEVPKELCWSWEEFIKRLLNW